MANIEKTSLLEMVYPIGSIYMSVNATNPSALFGGTWVKIEGRFLLGSTDAYTKLADENGSFTLTGTTRVRYGLDGYEWIEKVLDAGTYEASNAFFGGDPAPGLSKVCQKITSNIGTIGGEAEHLLTTNEMPRHNHTFSKFLVANADGHGSWVGYNQYSIAIRHSVGGTEPLPTTGSTEGPGEGYVGNENNLETHMNATGGSQAHNNMPPYLVVNIWKRTA